MNFFMVCIVAIHNPRSSAFRTIHIESSSRSLARFPVQEIHYMCRIVISVSVSATF